MRLRNEFLNKHTTFKIGGPAEILSIPETLDDLLSEIEFCKKRNINFRILGRGSNLLVDDRGIKGFIIKLNKACGELILKEKNTVDVGCGVSLNKFISFLINHDLGGYELLSSIPGTVGGAIYMNAGIGGKNNISASISDYLISVKLFDGNDIVSLPKEECSFDYRTSIFQKKKEWILLSALFKLPAQEKAIGLKRRKERMNIAKKKGYFNHPSAGSVFNQNYTKLASFLMRGRRIGNAQFAEKNGDWINNLGNARYKDVISLIKIAKLINFLFFKKAKLEIEIWK